jgi:hypothetical protein
MPWPSSIDPRELARLKFIVWHSPRANRQVRDGLPALQDQGLVSLSKRISLET